MHPTRRFALFLVCSILTFNRQGTCQDGLQNFVYSTMLGFSEWIVEQGLDPTPPLRKEYGMTFSNANFELDGTMDNISLHGLSHSTINIDITRTNYASQLIDIDYQTTIAGVAGVYYNARGLVAQEYPICSDSGNWSVTSGIFTVTFKRSFKIENDYIILDPNDGNGDHFTITVDDMDATFDGLLTPDAAEYEREMMTQIASELCNRLEGGKIFMGPIFTQFLNTALSVTTVNQIINWPTPLKTAAQEKNTSKIGTRSKSSRSVGCPPPVTTPLPGGGGRSDATQHSLLGKLLVLTTLFLKLKRDY